MIHICSTFYASLARTRVVEACVVLQHRVIIHIRSTSNASLARTSASAPSRSTNEKYTGHCCQCLRDTLNA
jgi:hypothetical protein